MSTDSATCRDGEALCEIEVTLSLRIDFMNNAEVPLTSDAWMMWLPVFIVLGFVIIFPLFWCGVVLLISYVGDWSSLKKKYAAPKGQQPFGEVHGGVFGWVGLSRYKFTLTVHLTPEGFFLENSPFFRVGHPRLFIPWSEVKERQRRQVLVWDMMVLTIGDPKVGKIALPAKLFEKAATV